MIDDLEDARISAFQMALQGLAETPPSKSTANVMNVAHGHR